MTIDKPLLEQKVDSLREPFRAFFQAQTTASACLILALAAAMIAANSPLAAEYLALRRIELGLIYGENAVTWSLLHFVNDGLIALFFLLIGLEVKRELIAGELSEPQRVRLLFSAAIGGMALPAAIYLLINGVLGGSEFRGWGIPMATDTAIAIGVLAALGAAVPRSLVAFLIGVAIVDDLGAMIVIAAAYTENLSWPALLAAVALFAAMLSFNRAGLRHPVIYGLVGVVLWLAIVRSGVHASIAGVAVAAAVPARPRITPGSLKRNVDGAVGELPDDSRAEEVLAKPETHRKIARVETLARVATTPLRRWEDSLQLPVALFVLPLFAFLNAGLPIGIEELAAVVSEPVGLGVLIALLVGKPVGLLGGVWLAERGGWASRPSSLTWRHLFGVGLVAGIGFTMSTFIAHLALTGAETDLAVAKLAIVVASTIAAAGGYCVLRFLARSEG